MTKIGDYSCEELLAILIHKIMAEGSHEPNPKVKSLEQLRTIVNRLQGMESQREIGIYEQFIFNKRYIVYIDERTGNVIGETDDNSTL